MNRVGSLLTGLMLLAAQVPWITCPCPDGGRLSPAVAEQSAHAHHHGCSGHGHHHAPAPKPSHPDRESSKDRGPSVETPWHIHGVLTADLVVHAHRTKLPALDIEASPISGAMPFVEVAEHAPAWAAGREPPPPRPPSAARIEDNVRLLS